MPLVRNSGIVSREAGLEACENVLLHFFCCLLSPQCSLCSEPLIELSNSGASGSIFYVSSDDEFIIKTVQHKEAEFLQKLLPGYYMVSQPRGRAGQLGVRQNNPMLSPCFFCF